MFKDDPHRDHRPGVKYYPGEGEPPTLVKLARRFTDVLPTDPDHPPDTSALLEGVRRSLSVERLAVITGRADRQNLAIAAYATPQHLAHEPLLTVARLLGDDLPARPDRSPRTVAGEGLNQALRVYAFPLFEGRRPDTDARLVVDVTADLSEKRREQLWTGLLYTRQACEVAWLAAACHGRDPRPMWQTAGGAHLVLDGEGRVADGFTGSARELVAPYLDEGRFRGAELGSLLTGSSPALLQTALRESRSGAPHRVEVETLNGRTISLLCLQMDPWVEAGGDVLVLCRDESVMRRLLQTLEYKERMAALGAATAGAAHEINNKLASTLTLLRLLGQPGLRPSERNQHLGDLQLEVTRASEMVGDLLDLARAWEEGFEAVHVGEVLQDLLALTRKRRENDRVKTELDLPGDSRHVFANRAEVEQILRHLVDNALDALEASDPEPGDLRRLWLRAAEDAAGRVEISVRDNAGGVPEDLEGKIFDRFFTTRSEQGSAGIGLTTARTLADRNGGELRLENEPGEAARFVLTLPSITPEEGSAGPPARINPEAFREKIDELSYEDLERLRDIDVLIVDDEPVLRSSLRNLLRLYSKALITEAANAEEARRAIEGMDGTFDVILLDIRLPDQNGRQLYEELKKEDPGVKQRVIFVAGERIEGDLLAFFRSEGVPHIGKPFQPEVLLGTMLEVLEAGDGEGRREEGSD